MWVFKFVPKIFNLILQSEKHSNILEKMKSTQLQLQKAQKDLAAAKAKAAADEDGDSLDSYMSNLSSVGCTDKRLISKLKVFVNCLNIF